MVSFCTVHVLYMSEIYENCKNVKNISITRFLKSIIDWTFGSSSLWSFSIVLFKIALIRSVLIVIHH